MWNNLKRLLTANPLGFFIWGIIAKWYIAILVASVIVLFWTFKGLESAGVLTGAKNVFDKAINDVKWVAKKCVPQITDLNKFWECLQIDHGKYEETNEDAKKLEDQKDNMINEMQEHLKENYDPETRRDLPYPVNNKDPYEQ